MYIINNLLIIKFVVLTNYYFLQNKKIFFTQKINS